MSDIKKEKNILYIGSGNSATLAKNLDLDKYTVCCANNAWKLFEGQYFDYWIHSGDFPNENRPKKGQIKFKDEISYTQYKVSSEEFTKKIRAKCTSPQHYLGYTIFFLGLYWIINTLDPEKISLLGFDHDYNSDKVKKWNENNRPNPQNQYWKEKDQTIADWSNSFFAGMDKDFFYGHGTPDPIRLGEKQLIDKFQRAVDICKDLNIKLVNLSPVESKINNIEKEEVGHASK